jgi:SpoVK/Ycf46/Vps4 family AAA+-type ATPase
MAAEVLARELNMDLYRVDLARIVSKYIGETEKNLDAIFSAAEHSDVVLLFDEADALFGKRTEVRDSHDRYANVEISYLLQRMESFQGLAILTTNMKQSLDPAFLRRLRFVVQFPFPHAEHRAEIWKGMFPSRTPVDSLDFLRLSQLNLAGGNIRNVAHGGAFLAADRGEHVTMSHLAEAARSEYAKLERPLSDAEGRGWA